MKSEINVDVDTANGDDAIAVTGTETVAAIESVAADVSEVATAADPGAAAVRILKTATCPSLSGKSILKYSIGANSAGEIGFCIVANSGGGLFNKEWIPQSSIQQLLSKIPKGNPIRSGTFTPIFHGKSVNTAGFLLAVLRDAGLLQPLKDKPRCYELLDATNFIAEVNALLELPAGVAIAAPSSSPVRTKTSPLKSKAHKTRNQ